MSAGLEGNESGIGAAILRDDDLLAVMGPFQPTRQMSLRLVDVDLFHVLSLSSRTKMVKRNPREVVQAQRQTAESGESRSVIPIYPDQKFRFKPNAIELRQFFH